MTLRRMLAVTHEASYTGAPILFADFLEWVREQTPTEVHTLVLADGPMVPRYEEVGPVTVLDRGAVGSSLAFAERGLAWRGSRRAAPALAAARLRPQLRGLGDFDLVYLNSLTSIEVAPHLRSHGAVVSHIHELSFALRSYGRARARMLEHLRDRPDGWIAVCGEVQEVLADLVGVPVERIAVHHPFVDVARIDQSVADVGPADDLRERLGIPAGARIVMGSGTIDWRKGPELFVQLAAEVARRSSDPVHFVWVGGETEGPNWERVRTVLDRTGSDHVHFVGSTPDPLRWFTLADVFVLTSHEDPFPLVCLEHSLMRHPVVTYRNGGIVELLEAAGPEAARGVVDHLDVGGMATAVLDLLGSERLHRAAGEQLRQRVVAHHDRADRAGELYETLEEIALQSSR